MAFTRKRVTVSAVVSGAAFAGGLLMTPVHWGSLGIAAVVGVVLGLIHIKFWRNAGLGVFIVSLLVLSLSRRLSLSAYNLRNAEGIYGGYVAQFYGLALLLFFGILSLAMRKNSRQES